MGVTEALLAQSMCNIAWGLFSAQPLILQVSTGPVLIFEASMFKVY